MTETSLSPVQEGTLQPGRSEVIKRHVTAKVSRLQGAYLQQPRSSSESVRTLALLRRSLGAAGAADPRMWALVLDDLPPGLMGSASRSMTEPTRAELAVLAALTTYSVHQQGQRTAMHVVGIGLGDATQQVARSRARSDAPSGLDDATVERLHRVSMAQTGALRHQALRALVSLMRSSTPPVSLDYGQLASDLYWLQDPRYAPRVHLRWGRQLHTKTHDRAGPGEVKDDAEPATTGEDA